MPIIILRDQDGHVCCPYGGRVQANAIALQIETCIREGP